MKTTFQFSLIVSWFFISTCESPVQPLERDSPNDPKSRSFLPIPPDGNLAFTGNNSEITINVIPKDNYHEGIQIEKATNMDNWFAIADLKSDKTSYIDESKHFSKNTIYRFRVYNQISNDTSFSEWVEKPLLFDTFNRQLQLVTDNSISWSKHHPVIEKYNVYYVISEDLELKNGLTSIESDALTLTYTFPVMQRGNHFYSELVVEGVVNDGVMDHMVTRESVFSLDHSFNDLSARPIGIDSLFLRWDVSSEIHDGVGIHISKVQDFSQLADSIFIIDASQNTDTYLARADLSALRNEAELWIRVFPTRQGESIIESGSTTSIKPSSHSIGEISFYGKDTLFARLPEATSIETLPISIQVVSNSVELVNEFFWFKNNPIPIYTKTISSSNITIDYTTAYSQTSVEKEYEREYAFSHKIWTNFTLEYRTLIDNAHINGSKFYFTEDSQTPNVPEETFLQSIYEANSSAQSYSLLFDLNFDFYRISALGQKYSVGESKTNYPDDGNNKYVVHSFDLVDKTKSILEGIPFDTQDELFSVEDVFVSKNNDKALLLTPNKQTRNLEERIFSYSTRTFNRFRNNDVFDYFHHGAFLFICYEDELLVINEHLEIENSFPFNYDQYTSGFEGRMTISDSNGDSHLIIILDRTVKVYDLKSGALLLMLEESISGILRVFGYTDDHNILLGDWSDKVYVLNSATGLFTQVSGGFNRIYFYQPLERHFITKRGFDQYPSVSQLIDKWSPLE